MKIYEAVLLSRTSRAHHVCPIALWLERANGIWKVMGLNPVAGSENSIFVRVSLNPSRHFTCMIKQNIMQSKPVPIVLEKSQKGAPKMAKKMCSNGARNLKTVPEI